MIETKNKKYWSAKYERCFRKVIVDEKDFTLMEAILSTILGGKVQIIGYIMPTLSVDNKSEKEKTPDLLIKRNGEYINLEIETGTSEETLIKNFYYFISMYKQNIIRGEKYNIRTKFVQIILQFGLSLKEEIIEEFSVQSETNVLISNFKIIRVNMDRITKMCYSNITKDIDKYKYLIMLDLPKEDLENFGGDDAIVNSFKSKIFKLNENERFQLDMTKEEVEALVINTGKALAYEEGVSSGISQGITQGITQGINQGISQGEKQKQIEIAKEMIARGLDISLISDITKLSLKELEKMNCS